MAGHADRHTVRIGLREPATLDFAARVLGRQPAAKADDLDRLFPRCGERPVLDILGQCQISLVMLWTAPTTGMAMCQLAVSIDTLPMSGFG